MKNTQSSSLRPEIGTELRVRLNMDLAPKGMELLTPGGAMWWHGCRFELNPPEGGTADFCVVLANARPVDRFRGARSNTLFIAGEPLEKKVYPVDFYAQFGHVLDTHRMSGHPNLILGAPGLNWHVGLDLRSRSYRYGYDHLRTLAYPLKENRVAVVCSDADHTPGQRQRLALLKALKSRFGDRIVHFGRGFEPIDDKMEAILPYRYHLVLENSQSPNYWTEKLADAYLGWAFPVYLGCPNIADFFPAGAYAQLDGYDVSVAERMLRDLLDESDPPGRLDALSEARTLILDRFNPFAWSAKWARELYRPAPEEDVSIRIHKAFRPTPRGFWYRFRRLFTA